MRRTAAGFTLLEAIFVLVVLGLLALLLRPVLVRCNHCGGNLVKCGNNHKDAILAVTLDSHIRRVTPSSPDITSSNIGSTPIPGADGGSLGVLNDDLPGS